MKHGNQSHGSKKFLPATEKQKQIISRLLKTCPDEAQNPCAVVYRNKPTRENADRLLLHFADEHAELLGSREDYIGYIAHRPNVETVDETHSHGLFTDNGVPIVMSHVMQEVANHSGNIWAHIVSLRPEDAEHLGYDSAGAWINLLRSQRNSIARSMKIAPENFRWYAAFHKEKGHPHVHMVAYSVNPREGFLTERGIEQIKSSLAREIFREDMLSIIREQTDYRDELRSSARELIENLVRQVQSGGCDKTFPEAVVFLNGGSTAQLLHSLPSEKEKKPFALPSKNDTMRRVFGYLCGSRGIDRDVLHTFVRRNMVYESSDYHNAVFVGYDKDNIARHAHKRGSCNQSSFKGNVDSSDPAFSFHWNGTSDSLYLFEAPIDMLSFISMHKSNWQQHSYAAACSVSDTVLFQCMKDSDIDKVYLCLDNDDAGQSANRRIAAKLKEQGVEYDVLVPTMKDWNEDLTSGCGAVQLDVDTEESEEELCPALSL